MCFYCCEAGVTSGCGPAIYASWGGLAELEALASYEYAGGYYYFARV